MFGVLTYMFGAVGLFLLSRTHVGGWGFMLAGVIWLAAFFLMLGDAMQPWAGFLQRVAETILWLAVLFIAFRMTDMTPETRAADA